MDAQAMRQTKERRMTEKFMDGSPDLAAKGFQPLL
jgi:hypothetical protein